MVNFGVVILIAFRTLSSACFDPIDINLSLGALIFSVIAEIFILQKTTEIK